MDKESIKEYFMQIEDAEEPNNRWKPELVVEIVHQMMDDFERELVVDGTELTVSYLCGVEAERRRNILKTCENCKHHNHECTDSSRGIIVNCKLGVSEYVDYDYNEEHCSINFGCNKFSRKEE